MHAILPEEFFVEEVKKRIEDLEEGEWGSIPVYALATDEDGCLWLDPGISVTLNVKSFLQIKLTEEGYEVSIEKNIEHKWEKGEVTEGKWSPYTLPVSKLEVVGRKKQVYA